MPVILPAPDLPSGRRSALVIATGTYTDERLAALRSPGRDAQELASLLGNPQIGGFAVTVLLDRGIHQLRVMSEEFLATRERDETVIVYLSCHGVLSARRRLYFATVDTRQDRLASTGLEARWVIELLDQCEARRQVVLLDCCFSGAFALTKTGKGAQDVGLEHDFGIDEGRGRIVLTASRATEHSFEGEAVDDGSPTASVFTAALAEGLRTGFADIDRDGLISVSDLYGFVRARVRATNAAQTPQRWIYGGEGEVILARSPGGRVVEPVLLTDEIRALLDSASPRVRLAGVAELGDWLAEQDLRRSLAARLTLEEIATRDNPQVADAARQLLKHSAGVISPGSSHDKRGDALPSAAIVVNPAPSTTAGRAASKELAPNNVEALLPGVRRPEQRKVEAEERSNESSEAGAYKRQPVIPLNLFWLISCSSSMAGSKLSQLNFAMREALPELSRIARMNSDIQIYMRVIAYADGAHWVDSMPISVESYIYHDLQAQGGADLGAAFSLVAHELQVPPMPLTAIRPVIIVVSDGPPTDNWRLGLRAIQASAWGPKAQRFALAIGNDADRAVLEEFLANPELEPFPTARAAHIFGELRFIEETLTVPEDVW